MAAHVLSATEDVEKDKSGRHRRIEHAQEDESGDHEAEADKLVGVIPKRAKGRRDVVLCTCVGVRDGATDGEDEDFADSDCPEGLWKVLWFLHLGNERGNGDLSDESVTDVKEGIHARNESRPCEWYGKNLGFNRTSVRVASRVVFDSRKDCCKEHRNEGKDGGEGREFRKSVKGTWEGAHPGDDSHDHGKDDGAYSRTANLVARYSVEIFCPHQAVKALENSQ